VPDECDGVTSALAQPLAVALHALRRSEARPGEALAVFGVGGIGSFIVAAAAAKGITPLIAVDVEESRLETARLLGADVLVDARSDGRALILESTEGEGPSAVVEASGNPRALADAAALTRRGGRLVVVGLQSLPVELDMLSVTLREIDVITSLAHVCDVDLPEAITMLADNEFGRHVIAAVIPLEAVVDAGLRPLASGQANGKIVVDLHA
jgi:(R,R)-butanediol dehydrogenase/meso-butanediol dehydrogenase/diacetyl reductase